MKPRSEGGLDDGVLFYLAVRFKKKEEDDEDKDSKAEQKEGADTEVCQKKKI